MKKGQMEIFGLLIIVILFVLILVFYLAFTARSQGDKPASQEIRQSIEVENLLTAMMKVTPCTLKAPPDSLNLIIRDCHLKNQDVCDTPCQPYIQDIVQEIMSKYGKPYEFKVKDSNKVVLYKQGRCQGEKLVDDFPIKAGNEFLVVELSTC